MEERFEQLLENQRENTQAYEQITKRFQAAKIIVKKIAKIHLVGLVHE
jgi:hypothetical protein